MSSRTKILLGGSLGLMAAAVVLFFVFFYQPRLTIIPNPATAQVLLNDQLVPAGTPLKLSPGTYAIEVSAAGYLTTTKSVSLAVSQVLNLPISLKQIPPVHTLTGGVAYPVLSADQKTVYFLGRGGSQFFTLDSTSDTAQPIALTDDHFRNIAKVTWSPDRSLVLLTKQTGETSLFDFQRYDFVTQEEKNLGSDFRSVTWHPTEHQFVAFSRTPTGERSLIRQTIDTGKTERLIDLRASQFIDPALTWSPDGRQILLVENGTYLFDVSTRTMRELGGGANAQAAQWSPTGEQLLIELTDGLGIVSLNKPAELVRLSIRTTLAKSAWTPDGRGLVMASPTDQTQDLLQMVNAKDGKKTLYGYRSDTPISAENLLVGSANHQLMFTTDGTLATVVLEPQD